MLAEMTSTETLTQWRDELAAEAEQLETELTTAIQDQRDAAAVYQQASDAWIELRNTLTKPFSTTEEMAGELFGRLGEARREMLRSASGARAMATGRVMALQGTLAGRRLAIRQLDRALADSNVTRLRRSETVPRPKPALIEFDVITMPHEVNNGSR